MKAFFTEVVAPVASHPDVTLCLRFDSEQDGSLADAQHLVDQLSREHLEDTALLEVVLAAEPVHRSGQGGLEGAGRVFLDEVDVARDPPGPTADWRRPTGSS